MEDLPPLMTENQLYYYIPEFFFTFKQTKPKLS
jgi:hypothetical protein